AVVRHPGRTHDSIQTCHNRDHRPVCALLPVFSRPGTAPAATLAIIKSAPATCQAASGPPLCPVTAHQTARQAATQGSDSHSLIVRNCPGCETTPILPQIGVLRLISSQPAPSTVRSHCLGHQTNRMVCHALLGLPQ